jgi:hypothetical protein
VLTSDLDLYLERSSQEIFAAFEGPEAARTRAKIKLKRTTGEVVDTATSLGASPSVNQAIDAPDGDRRRS